MSKAKMPEPVAYRFAAPIAGEGGGIVGRRDWQYSATQKGLPWWDRNGLVTQEQVGAYAESRVREALEEAAKACEARIGTGDPGINTEDADTEAKECAMAIRALIQNQ